MHRLALNLRLLCAFRAFQMALLPIAIVPLYWRDDLGLTMAEIFSLQALFGLFVACLEFPGGFVADRMGYRSALGLATVFSVVGWIAMGNADGFWTVLAAELLFAFSLALTSGTDSAMLYESCVELGEEHEFARWFGRSRSIGALSEGTGALVAGLLYSIWAPLPFYLQAALWLVNGLIVLALV
ncbi:MAG: MFS transporter, partial [Myxococcota bacterium]|nr:MFS transporter [Myxococcota bacterium]